jgi:hypothetical protein
MKGSTLSQCDARDAGQCAEVREIPLHFAGHRIPVLGASRLGITFGLVPTNWNLFWFPIFVPLMLAAFLPELFGIKHVRLRSHLL